MIRKIEVGGARRPFEYPDKCPICHRHSEIITRNKLRSSNDSMQVVFQCAYQGCQSYFIGYYESIFSSELASLKPQRAELSSIPESVCNLSPNFVAIYREAEEAQSHGLTQIAGPGYRKAFEFLIKDYAKSLRPEESDKIESWFSGKVLNEFVADPRIQAVGKRALWLGNDETHYLKKWANHDLTDLITLIRLAINWVEIERLSASYEENMPE
ncbi:DUF4145 domain-containing protein [Vibrio harveyi]|nr:DUF4145 domain-containing protein [Vibrio harveyi]